MKIKSFSSKNNIDYLHYNINDLKNFIKYSYEGTAGALLISRDNINKISHYRVSGTIDKPYPVKKMKELYSFRIKHFPLMDGEWRETKTFINYDR